MAAMARSWTGALDLPTGEGMHETSMSFAEPSSSGTGRANWIGLWTLYRREVCHFLAVAAQTVGLVSGGTLPCGKGVFVVVNHEEGHPMRKFIAPAVALAGVLATGSAFAQGTQPQQGGMMQMMPMQQGQAGQQGGMAGCPMMQRMAAMDTRLKQLEERAGVPTPPAQPGAPGTVR